MKKIILAAWCLTLFPLLCSAAEPTIIETDTGYIVEYNGGPDTKQPAKPETAPSSEESQPAPAASVSTPGTPGSESASGRTDEGAAAAPAVRSSRGEQRRALRGQRTPRQGGSSQEE
jgi:hypothetical protein